MSMFTTDATASDNKGTAYWQALDNAHHLHPFTDSAALHARGSRVIARAEGSIYGIPRAPPARRDGRVMVRKPWLWPADLVEAAYQHARAALLQQLFPDRQYPRH